MSNAFTFLRFFFLGLLPTVLASNSALAQSPPFDRAMVCAPSINSGTSVVSSTVTDAAGNVYIAGWFTGTVNMGSTTLSASAAPGQAGWVIWDVFVAKLSPAGNYLWAVRAGGTGNDRATALALDAAGNVYVTGSFHLTADFGNTALTATDVSSFSSPDMFVAKLSPAGVWRWAIRGGGTDYDEGRSIAADGNGNVYYTGLFSSATASFGSITLTNTGPGRGYDALVARLDANGSHTWAVRAGGSGSDTPMGLVLDGSGNLCITGTFSSPTMNFGTTTITKGSTSSSATDIFVAKLSPGAAWLWAVSGGGNGSFASSGIATDAAGMLYIAGNASVANSTGTLGGHSFPTYGSFPSFGADILVAQLDGNGSWRWVRSAGGGDVDLASALTVDSRGTAYLTGYFRNAATFGNASLTSAGGNDVFVAGISSTGAWQWAAAGGGTVNDEGNAVAIDNAGRLYLGGSFMGGEANFGSWRLTGLGTGSATGFLASINAILTTANPAVAAPAFSLAPNPATGQVRVSGLAPGQPVQLLDALGRVVAQHALAVDGVLSLDVPAGLYLVRSGRHTRRLVVE